METNDSTSQLDLVSHLRSVTLREAGRTPRGAAAVMAGATVLYWGGYSFHSRVYSFVAPVAWTAFVVAWVLWLQTGKRALPGRPPRSRVERRRAIVEWVLLLMLVNVIVIVGSHVSWLLVGVLLGSLGSVIGAVTALRASRS